MIFRIILGAYLTYHFIGVLPDAEDLFGTSMPYDVTLSPLYGYLWNPLAYMNATLFVAIMLWMSCLLVWECYPRLVAALLWYGWICLFNWNPLISNPGLPYVGFCLLSLCFVEEEEYYESSVRWVQNMLKGRFPNRLFYSAWFLMAAGYLWSGCNKLKRSVSWQEGTALQYVLEGCLARDNFLRDFLLNYPSLLKFMTYFSLGLELAAPLGLFYHTRLLFWLLTLSFHIGIMMLINFEDLTLGVMMIHFMTFEARWIEPYLGNYLTSKRRLKND